MKLTGCELIANERARQMTAEGWTAKHDDEHINGELRDAALAYAIACDEYEGDLGASWFPETWSPEWWKPSDDPIRNLVKAGALIAAEIDRLQRKANTERHAPSGAR